MTNEPLRWAGGDLRTAGEITDAALRVARSDRSLAPLFLAQYAAYLAERDVEDPAFVAVENLVVLAGHYGDESFRLIVDTYGGVHQARLMTKGPSDD